MTTQRPKVTTKRHKMTKSPCKTITEMQNDYNLGIKNVSDTDNRRNVAVVADTIIDHKVIPF